MFTGKHTLESKKKISEALRGRKLSKVTKDKLSQIQKNIPHYCGNKSPHWKGGIAAYQSIHDWVRATKGVPRVCCFCFKDRLRGNWIEWASVGKTYKYNPEEWISLCKSCHKKYDARIGVKASEVFVKHKGDTRYYGRR